jgi:hypothetical protein
MSKLETNTIDTISGTSNLTIGSTNSSTVTFENGAVTGHMYPAFEAYLSTEETLGANNTYEVIPFDTEVVDTDNAYSTSTYRFTVPTGKAGKYFIAVGVRCVASSNTRLIQSYGAIYLNGSRYRESQNNSNANYTRTAQQNTQAIMNLSVGDYVQGYVAVNETNTTATYGDSANKSTYFLGYRIGA